jgi:predicted alpha/beta hydrolase
MNASHVDAAAEVEQQNVQIEAADGLLLAGTWFLPDSHSPPVSVVVVAGGGGIPASRYHRFAQFLAGRGLAVLTFDYRGIGLSRTGRLRGFKAGTEDWGQLDFGAALAKARAVFPDQPVQVVAHSIGALLVGAAPDASRLERLVFFGPHTGYYGDYLLRWRGLLYLVWHLMMPLVTKFVGYFPGRSLHLGEDLPREFALDWSRRTQPGFLTTADDRQRFGAILERYREVHARALVFSVADDAFAPPAAGKRLIAVYPNIVATHEIIRPAAMGRRRLGHFFFLRRSKATEIWERTAAWLLQPTAEARTDETDASTTRIPFPQTQRDLFAGSATP